MNYDTLQYLITNYVIRENDLFFYVSEGIVFDTVWAEGELTSPRTCFGKKLYFCFNLLLAWHEMKP